LLKRFQSFVHVLMLVFSLLVILLPSFISTDCYWVAEAATVALNDSSVSGADGTSNSPILVVQHIDERFGYADYALRHLGVPHDTVTVNDFSTTDISKYKIIIVGSFIGQDYEVIPCLDAKSVEIEDWVTSGGCLAVFSQYKGAQAFDLNGKLQTGLGSGYYKWMPGKPEFVSVYSDCVSIVNSSNPILLNFTDYDLSFWDTSADGYFVQPPGEILAIQDNIATRPVLYTQVLGEGKIVATSLDPDYHGFVYNNKGSEGKEEAQRFLRAVLSWFDETGLSSFVTKISVFTSASSIAIGYKVSISGMLSDLEGKSIAGEKVLLSYMKQGLSTWVPITSVVTDSNGAYSFSWFPNATGNFTIAAEYTGNETYSSSRNFVSFSVQKYSDAGLFYVESNSTVSALAFNSSINEVAFSVSGLSGTFGYIRFVISKTLIANVSELMVYIDDKPFSYSITEIADSWVIYFEYTHSTHDIRIVPSKAENLQPQPTKPFPILEVAATVVFAVVISIGFAVYYKKHNN